MSTFSGKFELIPHISVDCFDNENLNSQAYFLSHCHLDHMCGIESEEFQTRIVNNADIYLYLSHVSAEILKQLYPVLTPKLRELDFYSATLIPLKNSTISVHPIPAGHCPGSVMFLFETQDNKTVLYTGDFRINPSDLAKFKALHDTFNRVKSIDRIYLDTTFFLKAYKRFPSREQSLQEICKIIKEWISQSDKHIIKLVTSARYGYEYLFMGIYREIKMAIHINSEIYEFYRLIPEMDNCVSVTNKNSQIHSACGPVYTDICKNSISYNIKVIKISAWRWQQSELQSGISNKLRYKYEAVCYSTHASYEEGIELLRYLKPKEVEPSVLHQNTDSNTEIYENIRKVLSEFNETVSEQNKERKLFKIDDNIIQDDKVKEESNNDDFDWILDSPPRKKYKE